MVYVYMSEDCQLLKMIQMFTSMKECSLYIIEIE